MFGKVFPSTATPVRYRPDRFQIVLEREMYFPGDIVKGNLYLFSTTEIKCRGVRIHIQGKGSCYFETGSGDNRQSHSHSQFYSNCKRTVFGNVHKTPIIRNAGANAIFGPPWAPDEGILQMGVPVGTQQIILRAMDYDWCKKDDLLGEVLVNINEHIGKPLVELKLWRKGKQLTGSIIISLSYDQSTQAQTGVDGQQLVMLKIHIFKALGLRSGDWFGKNDVYVQAYVPQAGSVVSMDKALPEPVMDMILPVGQFTIPFSFQLPSNLPSSMVSLSGDDYIAYSVYAHIDIAWKSDPSTRHFFTVMQHQNPSLYLTPSDRLDNSYHVYTTICCPCVCFGTQGNLTTKLHLDRTAYAPGEKALLRLEITSDWADFTTNWRVISVGLQQIVTCWAEGFKTSYNKPLMMPHMIFNNNPGIPMTTGAYVAHDVIIPIPITPPTYAGGLGRDSNWLGEVSRYGGVWASQSFDPIVWTYSITVELKLTLPGMSCGEESVFFNLPVVVTAVNKMSYDSILAGNDIFAATTRGQGSNGAQPRANVPSMPQQQQPMMMNQQQPMMMMGQQQQPMIMNQQQPMVMAFGQQQPMMMMGQQQQPMMTMTIGGTQQQPMMMMSFGQQQQPMMMMMGQQQPMMMMGQQQPMMGMGQQQPMMGMAQPQVAMGTVVSVRDGSHQHMQQTPVAKPASYDTPYQQKVPIQTETPVLIGAPYASPQTPAHPIGQDQGAALSSSYYGNDYGQSGTNSYANLPTVAAQTLSIATPQIAVPVASGTYGNSGSNQAGGYNADDYMHAPEANPAFSGVEVVKSTTQRVIRDPEEDFTVQNELELMYCPLYFKVN